MVWIQNAKHVVTNENLIVQKKFVNTVAKNLRLIIADNDFVLENVGLLTQVLEDF